MSDTAPDLSSPRAPSRKRMRAGSDTPEEQPARKRAADHDDQQFQRAFRQRTRDYIAELEERLANQAHSTSRKTTTLMAEVHALRRHCQALQRSLDSVVAVAARLEVTANDQGDLDHHVGAICSHSSNQLDSSPGRVRDPSHNPESHHEVAQGQLPSPPGTQPLAASPTRRRVNSYHHASHSPAEWTGPPQHASEPTLGLGHDMFIPNHTKYSVSAVLPHHLPPTCPLDRILLNLLASCKDMLARGDSLDAVLGPPHAIMTAMVDKSLAPNVHTISRILSEVLSTFPNVHLPQKMGMFYKMHLTMRVNLPSSPFSLAFGQPHICMCTCGSPFIIERIS